MASAEVRLPPDAHELVDRASKLGHNPRVEASQVVRFDDCLAFAPLALSTAQAAALLASIRDLETLPDVRTIADLTVAEAKRA